MKIDTRRLFYAISGGDAFNLQYVVLSIILVITLTTTSTLQQNIKEPSRAEDEILPKALKQTDKSEEPHLIRYMSDDIVIQEPNAIYLQCLVPQHLHAKQKHRQDGGVYTITWARELTSDGRNNMGNVQILSRNGRVSHHRSGKSGFNRRSSMLNRVRSWISQTTKGDEHVLMVRDTNRSLDEGIYSCQIHLNGNLVETKKSTVTFEESDYYDSYHDPMISNPTMFGPQGRSSPSIQQSRGDGSNAVAQSEQDSNPVTARFVIAKRGMNVILECHDHDVTALQSENTESDISNDNGITKGTVKNDHNYVWRKEGDSETVIGRGKKLKLVKVDRWDNGIYYCSANVHAKQNKESDGSLSDNRRSSFHLQVAAPRVSSNSPAIKDLGLDQQSLEKLKRSLHSTSTISSTMHVMKSGVLGRKDALHKNNILHQHAVFGKLGSSISLNCKAEGEPIPNVRWFTDKSIDEEAFQNQEEEVEILKFPSEKSNDNHPLDSNPMQSSSSSSPFVTEATSSSDIYSHNNGNPEVSGSDKFPEVMVQSFVKEEVKSSEEYAITINGYRDGGFESTLTIHNLQPHHFTKYYCEAQNSKGDDGLVIHLLKESEQQKRVDLNVQSNGGTYLKGRLTSALIIQTVIIAVVLNLH